MTASFQYSKLMFVALARPWLPPGEGIFSGPFKFQFLFQRLRLPAPGLLVFAIEISREFCYDNHDTRSAAAALWPERPEYPTEAGEHVNTREDYIGVFDSGVGGISVLRHLRRVMPCERFLYYGDSANAPYGTRSKEEVEALSFAVAEKLLARGLKALVVACNTATSAAIHDLRQRYPDLIIVGIEPALKLAADRYPGGGIGVMATPMTLREEKFATLMHRYESSCTIYKIPAPRLVEIVEAGRVDTKRTVEMLHRLFIPYRGRLDALVLGCTHYPFASHTISRILNDQVEILDGGDGTARETRRRLKAAGLLREGPGEIIIENSLNTPEILALSWKLLGQPKGRETENGK